MGFQEDNNYITFMFLVMDRVYMQNQFEYDEIQDVIDDIFTDNTKFDLKTCGDLIRGENDISFSQILIKIKDGILGEIRENIKT